MNEGVFCVSLMSWLFAGPSTQATGSKEATQQCGHGEQSRTVRHTHTHTHTHTYSPSHTGQLLLWDHWPLFLPYSTLSLTLSLTYSLTHTHTHTQRHVHTCVHL